MDTVSTVISKQNRRHELSEDAKDILGMVGGLMAVFTLCIGGLAGVKVMLRPSPMQVCIMEGYEWIKGDCVSFIDHDTEE